MLFCCITDLQFFVLSVIPQEGLFRTTSLKISTQVDTNCVTVRVGMCGNTKKRLTSFHTCIAMNAHTHIKTKYIEYNVKSTAVLAAETGD